MFIFLIVPAILEHEAIAGLNKDDRRGRVPTNETEPDALDNLQKIVCATLLHINLFLYQVRFIYFYQIRYQSYLLIYIL